MTNTLYIDGSKVGTVFDVDYTYGEDDVMTIPAGNDEVNVSFAVSAVDIEAIRKVFPLTDAQIFQEYVEEGGELDSNVFQLYNILSYTGVAMGRGYGLAFVLFKDGSTWVNN